MILDTITKSLQAKLTSAITTNPVSVTVDYMELPGSNQANVATLISVNTAVDILTAPPSGVQRIVNAITAFNDDTVTTVITFSVLDGATTSKDYKVTLAAGEQMIYTSINGWKFYDATGKESTASSVSITLTGDVTGSGSGTIATTLANIPSGVPMAGSLLATAITAPGTPAAGKGSIYVDSTSKNLSVKDDAGVVKHGVQTKAAVASNFLTAISDAGVVSAAQPAFTDITGAITDAQHGARSGGASLHPDATTTVTGFMSTTDKKRMAQVFDAVADFGFVGDLITVFDGAMTTGGSSTTLTCATSTPFSAGDVGKRITVAGAGAAGAQLTTTIASFSSSSVVLLTVGCSTTVTAKGVGFGTDNTTAITNMTTKVNTTNAAFPGIKIIFGQSATNAYGFPVHVTFNKTVQIEGIGGGYTTDSGDYTRIGGTRLAWWGTSSDDGAAFGPFFECSPTGVQALKRVAFRSCWIDCRNGDQNQALFGLKLASCHGFVLEDFFIMDALAAGLRTDIDTDPTEAQDITRFSIRDVCFRQLDNPTGAVTTPFLMTSAVVLTTTPQSLTVAANTLPTSGYLWTATTAGNPALVRYTGGGGSTTLTGCTISAEAVVHTPTTVNGGNIVQAVPGNGSGMIFDGSSTANTCCAIVEMVQISHGTTWGPAAIETRNSDTVDFIQVMINGGNGTNDGAINRIRKPGVRINGSIVSATLSSRNQTFRGGSAGAGGLSAMGVNNAGARLLSQSGPNYWDLYQLCNGEAIPTVEGNAHFDWSPNGAWRAGVRGAVSVADQAIAAATLTSLTGSLMTAPPQGFQAGAVHRWTIHLTSGAAGVAAGNVFTIRIGTAGTTADAAVATFTTLGLGTAVVSEVVVDLMLTIRTLGGAATVYAACNISNAGAAGAAVGFIPFNQQTLVPTLATFNSATAQQFINVCLTTSAAKTATIHEVISECRNPANP